MGWTWKGLGMGTRVVKNGTPGVSDIHWGWFVKLFAGLLVTLLGFGVQRAFYISAKIDVLEERVISTQREAETAAQEATSLGDELKRRVDEANKEHQRYLTRDEFFSYMSPELKRARKETR